MAAVKYRYFRSVEGRGVVRRFGTRSYVGVRRVPGGFEYSQTPDAMPESEYLRHKKAYDRAIKQGCLVEVPVAEAERGLREATKGADNATRLEAPPAEPKSGKHHRRKKRDSGKPGGLDGPEDAVADPTE